MKYLLGSAQTVNISMLRCLILLIATGTPASHLSAEEPALPLPAEPKHGRPYLMPAAERQRLRALIAREGWAKQEYEQLTKKAEGGDGYAAAFLYALERDAKYVPRCDQMAAREISTSQSQAFQR